MNKDQVKGRIEEAKGGIKEFIGKVVGNEHLEYRGTVQKITGHALASYGDLKNDINMKLRIKPADRA